MAPSFSLHPHERALTLLEFVLCLDSGKCLETVVQSFVMHIKAVSKRNKQSEPWSRRAHEVFCRVCNISGWLEEKFGFFFFCKMTDDGHHLQFLKKYGTRKMICRVKSKELLRSFSIYQTWFQGAFDEYCNCLTRINYWTEFIHLVQCFTPLFFKFSLVEFCWIWLG